MPVGLDESLTPAEYEALARFLHQCPDGLTPNLEALDGFFCALIVGPDVILPSEYLPLVLGSGSHFDSLEQVNSVLPLLMCHWNTIARALDEEGIYDLYLVRRRSHRLVGAEWAEAFMRGVDLRYDQWRPLIDSKEHCNAILPMMTLAQEKDPELMPLLRPMTKAARDELLGLMAIGLADLHRYFRDRRPAPHRRTPSRDTVRRATPKTGRNEPCPCGSGKKFKFCCGRAPEPSIH